MSKTEPLPVLVIEKIQLMINEREKNIIKKIEPNFHNH